MHIHDITGEYLFHVHNGREPRAGSAEWDKLEAVIAGRWDLLSAHVRTLMNAATAASSQEATAHGPE